MSDASMAAIARNLAQTLIQFARERRDEDRKTIAAVQTELCREYRAELDAEKETKT